MKHPVIFGNWKMNTNRKGALGLVKELKQEIGNISDIEVGICPPFVYLGPIKQALTDTNLKLGGQDMYWEEKGAFTGEIAGVMLKDIGCSHVIIGHSERRHVLGETDEAINKKLKSALQAGLTPIFCIGELLEEREQGITERVLRNQVEYGLDDFGPDEIKRMLIAYEPVWAIGTGKTATPAQAQEVHLFIRNLIARLANENVSRNISILYGGSVKPDNINDLMAQPDVDGALVGGASLKADSFIELVQKARKSKKL
ncbi:triose-phosphate isomerase [Planctomycetota bacterium]